MKNINRYELLKNKKLIIILIILLLIMFFLSKYTKNNIENNNYIEDKDSNITDDNFTEKKDNIIKDNNMDNKDDNMKIVNENYYTSEKYKNIIDYDLSKSDKEICKMLDESLVFVEEYYNKYKNSVEYISKNGFLYEVPSKSYVTVKDLLKVTKFDDKYSKENILFLYIKYKDLKDINGIKIKPYDGLKVFAVYETNNEVFISSESDVGGVISKNDFYKILDIYEGKNINK